MKLTNHGWSLKEMILLSSILMAFLLVAIFMIIRLYSGLNKSGITNTPVVHKYSYTEVENNLLEAALDYYNEYYDGEEDIRIESSKLRRKGYINSNELKANDEKKACEGYVVFSGYESKAYIKCDNFMTNGYEGD